MVVESKSIDEKNFEFVEFGVNQNGYWKRNIYVKENEIEKLRKQYGNVDVYQSIWRYENHKEDEPTVKCVAPLYFDIDNPNLNVALEDTRKLIDKLDYPENKVQIFFSGQKGFHVIVEEWTDNADALKKYAIMMKGTEIKSIDTQIYDKRRLLRLSNSKHIKTGLYKIPLTIDEIRRLSTDEIREIAKKPRYTDGNNKSFCTMIHNDTMIRGYNDTIKDSINHTAERADDTLEEDSWVDEETGEVFDKSYLIPDKYVEVVYDTNFEFGLMNGFTICRLNEIAGDLDKNINKVGYNQYVYDTTFYRLPTPNYHGGLVSGILKLSEKQNKIIVDSNVEGYVYYELPINLVIWRYGHPVYSNYIAVPIEEKDIDYMKGLTDKEIIEEIPAFKQIHENIIQNRKYRYSTSTDGKIERAMNEICGEKTDVVVNNEIFEVLKEKTGLDGRSIGRGLKRLGYKTKI